MHSEETKLKMSLSHKGKIKTKEHLKNISEALKGKKYSKERNEKLSILRKGKKRSPESVKKSADAVRGMHWNISAEGKKNMSVAQKERFKNTDVWNKGKEHLAIKGEKNHNWKGGKTKHDRIERVRFKQGIQKKVFERDNYTCKRCNKHGVALHVDHIKSWAMYPEERFNINNCETLCMSCHYIKTFKKLLPEGIIWGNNLSKNKKLIQ